MVWGLVAPAPGEQDDLALAYFQLAQTFFLIFALALSGFRDFVTAQPTCK
jgi:hypothetical protein